MWKSRKAMGKRAVRTSLMLAFVLALAGCDRDTTAPTDFAETDELADFAFTDVNASNPLNPAIPPIWRLPAELALTSEQEAQIRALIEQFRQNTRAEHEALADILREARAAAQAGKTREEIRAILQQGDAIRLRLIESEAALRTGILAVLTPAQKAWLESHRAPGCTAPALSEAQKTEISALIAAFQEANREDIEAVEDAFDRARAAQRAGASRREIGAILQSVAPELMRLRAAHTALAVAISAVLTPEQRSLGCRLPPRGS